MYVSEKAIAKDESLKGLLDGKPLMKEDLVSSSSYDNENSKFAVFNRDRFIGIYSASSESKDSEDSIIAKPEFVMS